MRIVIVIAITERQISISPLFTLSPRVCGSGYATVVQSQRCKGKATPPVGKQARKPKSSCRREKRCALGLHCTFLLLAGGFCGFYRPRLFPTAWKLDKGAAPSASWGVDGNRVAEGIGASKAGDGHQPGRRCSTIMLVCCSKVSPETPSANAEPKLGSFRAHEAMHQSGKNGVRKW